LIISAKQRRSAILPDANCDIVQYLREPQGASRGFFKLTEFFNEARHSHHKSQMMILGVEH
jgi:hypothetical protein